MGTSHFSPVCCLQYSLAHVGVQQLNEEVLSPQIALSLPLCPFNRISIGSEIQLKVHFKASAIMILTYLVFPITRENSELAQPQCINSEEITFAK